MKYEKCLIMQDEDITIHEEKLINCVPNHMRLGGYITAINNHSLEKRWKEWKWYKHDDGTMFNDRERVINMLSDFVRRL